MQLRTLKCPKLNLMGRQGWYVVLKLWHLRLKLTVYTSCSSWRIAVSSCAWACATRPAGGGQAQPAIYNTAKAD